MSLNQQVIAEFSPCTPSAPQLRDLSIQTCRPSANFRIADFSVNVAQVLSSVSALAIMRCAPG